MARGKTERSTRLAWLKQRPWLWSKDRPTIVREMKKAGLIAKTTNPRDVRTDKYLREIKAAI